MRIDAMLCDYAQVNGGKLYVTGASVNLLGVPAEPPYVINVWVAATIQVPYEAAGAMHQLKISVQDADGAIVPIVPNLDDEQLPEGDRGCILAGFTLGGTANLQQGDEGLMPLVVPIAAAMPNFGPFYVVMEIDGEEEARMSFRLQAPMPQMPVSGAGTGPADLPRF